MVLLMHSYGGIPGNGSAVGLSKKEREGKGEKGGVVGLVFVSSYVAREGQTKNDLTPHDHKSVVEALARLYIDVSFISAFREGGGNIPRLVLLGWV